MKYDDFLALVGLPPVIQEMNPEELHERYQKWHEQHDGLTSQEGYEIAHPFETNFLSILDEVDSLVGEFENRVHYKDHRYVVWRKLARKAGIWNDERFTVGEVVERNPIKREIISFLVGEMLEYVAENDHDA